MDVVVYPQDNSRHIWPLRSLLEKLLAWGNRPTYLIPMAYQWCSAISGEIREHWEDEVAPEGSQYRRDYLSFLSLVLAVAFRHTRFDCTSPTVHLLHTRHHEWMLDTVFISEDDDAIADAVCLWIVDPRVTPSGSCTRRLLELTERGRPFSSRLRLTTIHVVQQLWRWELGAAGLELVCLLNNLEVGPREIDDANSGQDWVTLLISVLCSRVERRFLSSHYWVLLGNLVSMGHEPHPDGGQHMEIIEILEEAQDWEKLETWMLVVWWTRSFLSSIPIRDIEWATLTLFRRRPSAIPRFEDLYKKGVHFSPPPLLNSHGDEFRQICDQARAEQSCLEPPS